MPLIIHPESSCDVCLESLTYDDPTPPYAIPCGHIFCRACLLRTDPRNCPLCRKPYLPERAKKLITGERAAVNDSGEDDLLRRLVVSWDIQEEQLVTLLTEVDAWLQSRPENTTLPLRKAREALGSFQKLKTQTESDRRTIKLLRHGIRHQERAALLDKDTAVAVEHSLLAQVEEMHTKVAEYESEIEKLRKELSAFKYTKNPLPPPPEPFPLDRLPPFAQATGSGSNAYHWHTPAESSSSAYPTNGNGHPNPPDIPPFRPHTPVDEAGFRSHRHHPREAEGTRSRDRKGKQRAREDRDRRHDTHRSPVAAPRGFPVNEADNTGANTSFNGNRNAIIPGATPNRRVVPNSVFNEPDIELYTGYESPVDPRNIQPVGLDLHFDNDPTQAIDPFTLTAGILQEYANGYGSGFQDATELQAPRTRGSAGSTNGAVQSSLLNPPEGRNGHSSRRPPPRWVTDPSAATAAPAPGHNSAHFTSPSHAIIADDAARAVPQWGQPYRDVHFAHYPVVPPHSGPFPSNPTPSATFIAPPGAVQEDSGNPPSTFQPIPPPPFTAPGYDSDTRQRQRQIPDSLRPRNHRRRTVQIDGNLTDIPPLEYPSGRASDASTMRGPALTRRPAARPAATMNHIPTVVPTIRPDSESRSSLNTARDSTASWGTVEGNGAPSVARTVQSVTDLALATFEDGAGVRGSMHSESSLISFSRGNPFQNHNSVEEEDVDRSHNNSTPRNRPASFAESGSTLHSDSGISQSTERSRDRRMASYPVSPSHVQGSRYTQTATLSSGQSLDPTHAPTHAPTHRSRRSSRHHHVPARVSPVPIEDVTPRSRPGTAADTTWNDAGYFTDAPLSSSDNALGLQISHTPQITAPTPVVSSRAFLRSFSHDYSRDYI